MTQTNTTQNKEELEEVRWRQRLQGWLEQVNLLEQKPNVQGGQLVFKGTRVTLTSLINFIIDVRDKSLSQAHQSGIEEGKKELLNKLYNDLNFHRIAKSAYHSESWDAGVHDTVELVQKEIVRQIKSLKENKQ